MFTTFKPRLKYHHFTSLFWVIFLLSQSVVVSARAAREKAVSYSINSSRSGVLFDGAIYYGQSEATTNPAVGNEWKNLTSVYDIKLGYISSSGIFWGGEYSTRNDSGLTTSSNGGTGAAGLGYFWGSGFHARTYYRINESWGDYTNGSGFQADVGYMVNMTSNFYLGLLVSHRQVTFTSNDTITAFSSFVKKDTQPMLTFGFLIN